MFFLNKNKIKVMLNYGVTEFNSLTSITMVNLTFSVPTTNLLYGLIKMESSMIKQAPTLRLTMTGNEAQ